MMSSVNTNTEIALRELAQGSNGRIKEQGLHHNFEEKLHEHGQRKPSQDPDGFLGATCQQQQQQQQQQSQQRLLATCYLSSTSAHD
jgi:hypothetical protein